MYFFGKYRMFVCLFIKLFIIVGCFDFNIWECEK